MSGGGRKGLENWAKYEVFDTVPALLVLGPRFLADTEPQSQAPRP